MKIFKYIYFLAIIGLLNSCETKSDSDTDNALQNTERPIITLTENGYYVNPINELTDNDYPDNPDIQIRHSSDGKFSHKEVQVSRIENSGNFNIHFIPNNEMSDTIALENINLLEWIPAAPEWVKKDEYLTYIGIINQEWNRQQVKFEKDQFKVLGNNEEKEMLTRVDLARNCLNAYLWEIIAYGEENGKTKPIYHGWFDFPQDLYAELFNERNQNLKYEDFKTPMENWVDPKNKFVNLAILRKVESEKNINYEVLNHELYPLIGERNEKNLNIVHPKGNSPSHFHPINFQINLPINFISIKVSVKIAYNFQFL